MIELDKLYFLVERQLDQKAELKKSQLTLEFTNLVVVVVVVVVVIVDVAIKLTQASFFEAL